MLSHQSLPENFYVVTSEFSSNDSRSRCPRLPLPGRCQELLSSSVWSHQIICHGVRNWYRICYCGVQLTSGLVPLSVWTHQMICRRVLWYCGADDLSKCVTTLHSLREIKKTNMESHEISIHNRAKIKYLRFKISNKACFNSCHSE